MLNSEESTSFKICIVVCFCDIQNIDIRYVDIVSQTRKMLISTSIAASLCKCHVLLSVANFAVRATTL